MGRFEIDKLHKESSWITSEFISNLI